MQVASWCWLVLVGRLVLIGVPTTCKLSSQAGQIHALLNFTALTSVPWAEMCWCVSGRCDLRQLFVFSRGGGGSPPLAL